MTLLNSDCLDAMRTLTQNSIDTIITDPPYGIGFMGKEWDRFDPAMIEKRTANYKVDVVKEGLDPRITKKMDSAALYAGLYDQSLKGHIGFQQWCETWAKEALRVTKPGGHLLCFGGTRTYHRLTCAIEDAGWEIRDCMMWLYGSGFPKSHNLKGEFEGWGTALKPAWEPIIVAMKPLDGTFAQNAEKHGVAGLSIHGSRIGIEATDNIHAKNPHTNGTIGANGIYGTGKPSIYKVPQGRWPANLILDEACAELLDEQTGELGLSKGSSRGGNRQQAFGMAAQDIPLGFKDSGGASRFFYCAKASKSERNEGCEGLPLKTGGMISNTSGQHITRRDGGAPGPTANNHPTVKPLKLMEYLCTLTKTPTGGIVLDPFMGSGTTGVACRNTGREFIGIEKEEAYFKIAQARIESAKAA